MNKRIISSIVVATVAVCGFAQSGTNSPYSQYGLGILSDQSQGFSRGMNGASLGIRQGNVSNTLNPASYSAVDSLTMIFDVGASGQVTNFKEGNTKVNANNANFEYGVGLFRLMKGVGVIFGVLPFSNVGYKYTSSTYLDRTNGTVTETFSGEGGLHQAFIGAGVRVFPSLSLGFNASYLWGSIDRSIVSSSTTYINSLSKSYSASVNSYKLDFGAQLDLPLSRKDLVTLGATVGLGHKLGADPECSVINIGTTGMRDTTTLVANDALEIPMTYGVGLAWRHGISLLVDADVYLQQWGKCEYPMYDGASKSYAIRNDQLKDRWKFVVGADYVPNALDNNYFKRIHYRLGAGYATPYIKINGVDGPKELSLSAGFGLPLQNKFNNRSMLNISAQYVRTSAKGMITENTFRINIGLTFNERWFFKWKID